MSTSRMLKCEICQRQFQLLSRLKAHVQTGCTNKFSASKLKNFSCKICGTTFKHLASLETHMLMHNTKSTEHEINVNKNEDQEQGMQNGTKPKVFVCGVCQKRYSCEFALKGHMLDHMKMEEQKCEVCMLLFRTPSEVNKHMRSHTQEDGIYCCDDCELYFYSAGELKHHSATHSNQTLDECDIYGKRLKLPGLKTGTQSYNIKDPYSCRICQVKCISREKLEQHLLETHTNKEKNEFTKTEDYESFEKNMRDIHAKTAEKVFLCEICGIRFQRLKTYQKHMRSVLSGDTHYGCETCGECFIKMEELKMHKYLTCRPKTYTCYICERTFILEKQYNDHMVTHRPKNADRTCMICMKVFHRKRALEKHMNKHTGHKPYKCDKCGVAYFNKMSLAAHKRLHLITQTASSASPETDTSLLPETDPSLLPETDTSLLPETDPSLLPETITSLIPETAPSSISEGVPSHIKEIGSSLIQDRDTSLIPEIVPSSISEGDPSIIQEEGPSYGH